MRSQRIVGGWALVTAVLTMALVMPACAQYVTFTPGNNPQSDEENILLNTGETGSTVQGTTNRRHLPVDFSSLTDTLTEPSSGQARVESTDGAINDLTIAMGIPGGTFGDFIMNPFLGGALNGGPATVTATVLGGGTQTFTYDLGNGNNFLTIVAVGDNRITSLNIASANGFADLRQPRISSASEGGSPPAAVPEPGLLSLLAGAGLSGGYLLRRRRG